MLIKIKDITNKPKEPTENNFMGLLIETKILMSIYKLHITPQISTKETELKIRVTQVHHLIHWRRYAFEEDIYE